MWFYEKLDPPAVSKRIVGKHLEKPQKWTFASFPTHNCRGNEGGCPRIQPRARRPGLGVSHAHRRCSGWRLPRSVRGAAHHSPVGKYDNKSEPLTDGLHAGRQEQLGVNSGGHADRSNVCWRQFSGGVSLQNGTRSIQTAATHRLAVYDPLRRPDFLVNIGAVTRRNNLIPHSILAANSPSINMHMLGK